MRRGVDLAAASVMARRANLAVCAVTLTLGCGPARQAPVTTAAPVPIEALWQEPTDLSSRDLFAGPGGSSARPTPEATYEFVAHKTSGTNPGYDVRTDDGRLWSVKLGEEAQPEVVTSRLLWAMGFHQPPTYYLDRLTLS